MLHGGFHTGACFLSTPDQRPGWAQLFAAQGHVVYVLDWPGHGLSPALPDFATLSGKEVAESIAVLVSQVGPAVLFAHSAAGPIAWWLLENLERNILSVVGLAPGPPSNLPVRASEDAAEAVRFDGTPGFIEICGANEAVPVSETFVRRYWANAPNFPADAFDAYCRGVVPESPRILNERFNKQDSGLSVDIPDIGRTKPVLVVTGEADPRHPREVDQATAEYLGADFVWLPDVGIRGNGHMLMIERNSDEVALVISHWLRKNGL
jgi:pimeloyl-ACP methyl ester carboxylesterase